VSFSSYFSLAAASMRWTTVKGRSELPLPRIEIRSRDPERKSSELAAKARLSLSGSAAVWPMKLNLLHAVVVEEPVRVGDDDQGVFEVEAGAPDSSLRPGPWALPIGERRLELAGHEGGDRLLARRRELRAISSGWANCRAAAEIHLPGLVRGLHERGEGRACCRALKRDAARLDEEQRTRAAPSAGPSG
jgi:hypothetical protein